MSGDPAAQPSDPWVAEMMAKIDALPDEEIARTSRVIAAMLKTAVRSRPKSAALRRAVLTDALDVAAVAAGGAK